MAITYNLPIHEWYRDTTSQWTLDYPPLFAFYEFLLAMGAHFLNLVEALSLSQKDIIRTDSVIAYQKLTVIMSDFVYYYAVHCVCRSLTSFTSKSTKTKFDMIKSKYENNGSKDIDDQTAQNQQNLLDALLKPDATSCIALLLLLQPGLLMVDHIHFQYNGFLSGLFLLSIANILNGSYATGSFWFAILLNFKHIYLYCSPAVGMYLLTSYCMASQTKASGFIRRIFNFIRRTLKLGIIVLIVFVIVYFPFASIESMKQILERLFPFKRGLTHAYWAPNIWSLYNSADKVLSIITKAEKKAEFNLDSISGLSGKKKIITSTSGLVQEYEHLYLPSIKPITTFILVAIFTLPLVIKYLFYIGQRETKKLFLKSIVLVSFTSFMFGWHVHEKAILLVLLPLTPIAIIDPKLRASFLRLTLAGTYSLFPLLFMPAEYLIKSTLLIFYYIYTNETLKTKALSQTTTKARTAIVPGGSKSSFNLLMRKLYNLFNRLFVLTIILIEIYNTLIHGRLNYSWNPFAKYLIGYDFLPLMATSSISAIGITFSYLELYYDFVFITSLDDDGVLATVAAAT